MGIRNVLDLADAVQVVQEELAGPLGAVAEPVGATRIGFDHGGRQVEIQFCTGFMEHAPEFAWVRIAVRVMSDTSLELFRHGETGAYRFISLWDTTRHPRVETSTIFVRSMDDLVGVLRAAQDRLK